MKKLLLLGSVMLLGLWGTANACDGEVIANVSADAPAYMGEQPVLHPGYILRDLNMMKMGAGDSDIGQLYCQNGGFCYNTSSIKLIRTNVKDYIGRMTISCIVEGRPLSIHFQGERGHWFNLFDIEN